MHLEHSANLTIGNSGNGTLTITMAALSALGQGDFCEPKTGAKAL